MTKLKLVVASAALMVGGLSGFALAKGHMGPKKELIEKFDANRDGKLDDAEKAKLREAKQAMHAQRKAERLAQLDTNKDGKVDVAERKAMRDQRIEARFAQLDANKDGAVTLEEMKAAKPMGQGHRGHRGGHRFQGGMTK